MWKLCKGRRKNTIVFEIRVAQHLEVREKQVESLQVSISEMRMEASISGNMVSVAQAG